MVFSTLLTGQRKKATSLWLNTLQGAGGGGRETHENVVGTHAGLQSHTCPELSADSLNLAPAAGSGRTGLQHMHCLCKALGA